MNNMRITVIEDNTMNSRLMEKVLETAGAKVDLYTNAEDALTSLPAFNPNTILLDLQLPGMSGYDFARMLKSSSDLNHIKIIAISANIRKEDQELALKSGCIGFITKPINTRTLVKQIKEYIE